jgi:hypothetical protein
VKEDWLISLAEKKGRLPYRYLFLSHRFPSVFNFEHKNLYPSSALS